MTLVMDLVSAVVGAAPLGLVLLLGLGAAGWLFGRSKVAAAALGFGVVALGFTALWWSLAGPGLAYAANAGLLPVDAMELVFGGNRLFGALAHGAGVLGCLIAVAAGPAPARAEEELE